MGDIITTFAKIGTHYLRDEKRVKNKAYEYDIVKVFLFDIETKNIEPSLNISKEDLIIARFGVGANSGNLFPNMFFEPKNVKDDYEKFIKGILKANKNLLSFFTDSEIAQDEKLSFLYNMNSATFKKESFLKLKYSTLKNNLTLSDYNYHFKIIDKVLNGTTKAIQKLEKYKKQKMDKGKVATYFALSYQGQPISSYFKNIYDKHLNNSSEASVRGYDIITNEECVGGDAKLAFCSVNELPKNLQRIKSKLLPLSHESAKKVKIGFDVMDKLLSHNFYGLKMAIMPTVLSADEEVYTEILQILEDVTKGEISEIEESEVNINEYLEEIANGEKHLPVLNTILFYNKNNAAVDMLLQIDDVLPSYISHISDRMGYHNIKAFKDKDRADAENTIYMQNIYGDRLEIMNILLSSSKINKDVLISKFSQLIYWGNINKKYAYPIDWSKYFNGFYYNRGIEVIKRYLALFNDTKKLKENFILQKECLLENINSKSEKIILLMKNSDFLDNEVLKTAYLLGVLSSALINWQYGATGNSSYNKWLNNSGAITKDTLDRIWKKAEESIRKLNSTTGTGNATVNEIKELVIQSSQEAFLYKGIVKSSYVSLAFAMGGSDYAKHIKDTKKEEKK